MAGLFDLLSSEEGRFNMGLLAAAAPRSSRTGFGERFQDVMSGVDEYKRGKQRSDLTELEMRKAKAEEAAMQRKLADEATDRQILMSSYGTAAPQNVLRGPGMGAGLGQADMASLPKEFQTPLIKPMISPPGSSPADGAGAAPAGGAGVAPNQFDRAGLKQFHLRQAEAFGRAGRVEQHKAALEAASRIDTSPKYSTYKPGDVVYDNADMSKPVLSVPDKADKPTSDIQNYQFAVGQGYKGTFEAWDTARKRAGATNIGMPRIDIKMGDSVAGQVGPMMKDSRVATQGAVKMFDAADRIEQALASNKVSSGPLASKIQTVKQLVQQVGGGNDESVRQTQQVIRSLAQMSVEARKQLQGQGQVTDSEAKAVAKADAGDIDSLTTGELADLVTLTKRAAHMAAKGHKELLDSMESSDGTRGAAPFYRVPGVDALLRHQPKLPEIGGGGDVRSRADAILGGK